MKPRALARAVRMCVSLLNKSLSLSLSLYGCTAGLAPLAQLSSHIASCWCILYRVMSRLLSKLYMQKPK